jgi:hypothetical protein
VDYKFREFESTDVKESEFLDIDSDLARNTLGWSPAWTQREAIVSTLNWWIDVENNKLSAKIAAERDLDWLFQFHGIFGNKNE